MRRLETRNRATKQPLTNKRRPRPPTKKIACPDLANFARVGRGLEAANGGEGPTLSLSIAKISCLGIASETWAK